MIKNKEKGEGQMSVATDGSGNPLSKEERTSYGEAYGSYFKDHPFTFKQYPKDENETLTAESTASTDQE